MDFITTNGISPDQVQMLRNLSWTDDANRVQISQTDWQDFLQFKFKWPIWMNWEKLISKLYSCQIQKIVKGNYTIRTYVLISTQEYAYIGRRKIFQIRQKWRIFTFHFDAFQSDPTRYDSKETDTVVISMYRRMTVEIETASYVVLRLV